MEIIEPKPFEVINCTPEENQKRLIDFEKDNLYGKAVLFNNNLSQFKYVGKANNDIYIQKLSDNEYLDKRTGEIKECRHIENRSENLNSIRQTMKLIRNLINCNVYPENINQWLFITLTYAENMQNTKKLYHDFRNFLKRFKELYPDYDGYIRIAEPQGRGAWHLHVLIKFKNKTPFIKDLQSIWKQGFVSIKKLNNVDNIGAYYSAYLGDVECTPENIIEIEKNGGNVIRHLVEEKEIEVEPGKREKKKFIKGARLYMYPPKMNIISYSKNMKKPLEIPCSFNTWKEKKIGNGVPTFVQFSDILISGKYSHSNCYIEYNKQKAESQLKCNQNGKLK